MPGGFLPISTIAFKYRSHGMKVHIRPARLELRGKDGKPTGETVEYYPSAREELIEHALRKIAVDQQAGFFDKPDFALVAASRSINCGAIWPHKAMRCAMMN